MSDQPENEEHLVKTSELAPKSHATESSHKNEDQNRSTKSVTPLTNTKTTPSINNEGATGCSRFSDQINVPESQMGALQMQPIRNEKKETKQPKRFKKLPTELQTSGPSCERDTVGDDFNKKKEVHILCECEPNVAGAAVPTVTSFISAPSDNKCNSDSAARVTSKNESQTDKSSNTPRNKNDLREKKSVRKANASSPKVDQKPKFEKPKISANSTATERNVKVWQGSSQSVKNTSEKKNDDNKVQLKKPSLIPKLAKTITSTRKNRNCSSDEFQGRDSFAAKSDSSSSRGKSSCSNKKMERDLTTQSPKKLQKPVTPKPLKQIETTSSTISSRVLGLQERLKATTSMLRQKIEMDKSKDQSLSQQSKKTLLEDIEANENTNSKKTVEDLYKNIFQLKDTVSSLSESNTFSNQRKYIEKLYKNISEIKNIANKLCEYENDSNKSELSDKCDSDKAELNEETPHTNSDHVLLTDNEKTKKSSANTKDNKIYIKFKPTRDKKDSRKKRKEAVLEQSEGVQTDLSLGTKLTSDSISSDTNLTSKMKEVDSMDGVFIPTCEPPVNIEEEEETNGLDITITFPEFNQLNSIGPDAHPHVCLSDISAEALKRLKRCPKDFTLLMDFVQGKVLFQSGKGPTNNFLIGPDFKFIENIIDDKKSDIISIKPSPECSYASQLIPVDTPKPEKSVKSLKSTDSELFNVVNLPFLYKNPYLDTTAGPKSCIALRNDKLMSMAILAKQFFKSMPQIPSLTNIFEDDAMENFSKTDSREKEEKSPESEKEG